MLGVRSGHGTIARDDPVRVVPALALPPPRTDGETALEQAILRRGSVRAFDPTPLTLGQLGQLLWAAQGTRERGRTVPSPGALYPLEIYVAHADGIYHYRSAGHEVAVTSNTDIRADLAIGAVPTGAFDDAAVAALFAMPDGTASLDLIPVGRPA